MGDEEPVDVTVLVDADQARWAVESAGEEAVVTRRAAGDVVLELRVTNRAALRSFVLGFLDHAEILGPSSERQALVAWLRAGAAGGGDGPTDGGDGPADGGDGPADGGDGPVG